MNSLLSLGLWRRSNAPKRHGDSVKKIEANSLSQDWTNTYNRLISQIKSNGRLLIFTGGRGSGKSQMAVSLIAVTCLREKACRYYTAGDMFRKLRATFEDDATNRFDRLMDEISGKTRDETITLLVIDEIHERKGSDWENQILTDIVDARYARNLSTILITNETPEEAVDTLGESIVDRARETGAVIPFRWGSFRKQLREANENENI